MASYIHCIDTLFDWSNLTPIRDEPTFKTIHKLRNKTKAYAKSDYSNVGGGSHGHLSVVLTDAKYSLILNILFVYRTHLGLLFITYWTTAHTNSNMSIMDTKEVCLFSEVTGVEQALV